MNLWAWAVGVYELPGVADACLKLQNQYNQNVSFLLWSIWANPDQAALERAAVVADRWNDAVLQPLRGVRGVLAKADPPVDDRARMELREEVIAAELLAERVLLETLETLGAPSKGDALDSLTAASAAWRQAAPREALAELAAAIS